MRTMRMEEMSIEELNAVIDACQNEINNRKEELKVKLIDEFEAWLAKVHNAGFEALDCDGVEMTSWNMEIVDKE